MFRRILYYVKGQRKAQYGEKSNKPCREVDPGWLECSEVCGEKTQASQIIIVPAGSSTRGQYFLYESHLSSTGTLSVFPKGSRKTAQLHSDTVSRDGPLSSTLTVVNVLNVLIEKVIFGNILGINRTLDNKFSPHCSSINYFNQIYEVLFGFETSHKLSVIWRPRQRRRETTLLRTFK